jgi:hypothetical protein
MTAHPPGPESTLRSPRSQAAPEHKNKKALDANLATRATFSSSVGAARFELTTP